MYTAYYKIYGVEGGYYQFNTNTSLVSRALRLTVSRISKYLGNEGYFPYHVGSNSYEVKRAGVVVAMISLKIL